MFGQRALCLFFCVGVSLGLSACGSGSGSQPPSAPAITGQPANQTVSVGQTATFSVVATGTSLSYQWRKAGTSISGATSANYTTPATALTDSGTQFSVIVSNSLGSVTSTTVMLTVTNTIASTTDVLTYHNDNGRTGLNSTETLLTPNNVSSSTFGKIGFFSADGLVDAEPLYASNVSVPSNGTHNILVVATEHNSVYGFDADSGTTLWHASMNKTGETPSDMRAPCTQVEPEIGVTSTPVIDRTRGPNGVIYVVAMSKNGSTYHQRLHALDLALGTELFGGPVDITGTYPGTGDNSNGTDVIFDPKQYKERTGLLLLNGTIYLAWASHCDFQPYTGWIMGYNASTLAQTTVLDITPNGTEGAIWQAGAGLAADGSGNIYFLVANGDFDETLDGNGFPNHGDYGNAFIKLSTSGGQLTVADYFEMDTEVQENGNDIDLGSGGAMLIPDQSDGNGHTLQLAVGAGKDNNIYLVNRSSMGKFAANNANIYQELTSAFSGMVFSMPAYFNGAVYYGGVGEPVVAYKFSNAKLLTTPTMQSQTTFPYPGTTPSISANGASNGIVWALVNDTPAVLHAYNATNLTEIYNSSQASGGRDHPGQGNKYITPMIANGKVFVAVTNGVAEFGLLP